jgi:hypothetical protein
MLRLWFLLLVGGGSGRLLEAEYSRFSGLYLVKEIFIGSSRQPLRFALDFNSDESFMFASTVCPPFVPACYKAKESVSGRVVGRHIRGFRIYEELVFPQSSFVTMHSFILVLNSEESFREVAGAIGAGPKSQMLNRMAFVLSIDDSKVLRIQSIGPNKLMSSSPDIMVRLDKREESQWMFEGQVVIDGNSVGSSVHFDPSEQFLVLPSSAVPLVLATLKSEAIAAKVDRDGILNVECSRADDVNRTLKLWVKLQTGSIRYFSSHEVGGLINSLCRTRIRFDVNVTDKVRVGRDLIKSVDGVILHFAYGWIGFRLRSPGPPPSMLVKAAKSLIPLYSFPSISTFDPTQGESILTFTRKTEDELILESLAVRPRIDKDGQELQCWSFLRLGVSSVARHIELPGVYKGARIRVDDDHISIRLSPVGTDGARLKASLVLDEKSVSVCIFDLGKTQGGHSSNLVAS